jgi:hypothetical protein
MKDRIFAEFTDHERDLFQLSESQDIDSKLRITLKSAIDVYIYAIKDRLRAADLETIRAAVKPCPFCTGKPVVETLTGGDGGDGLYRFEAAPYRVECNECSHSSRQVSTDPQVVIDEWNGVFFVRRGTTDESDRDTLTARIATAVELAASYGNVKTRHKTQWLIDQMLRALLDDAGYEEFVARCGPDGWWVGSES